MGLGWSVVDRNRATGKMEWSRRAHSGSFVKRIPGMYSMCQLLCWLAFEWNGKVLKELAVGGSKWDQTSTAEEASRGKADAAELQSRSDAASLSGFQVYPRDAEENAVFASGVCAKAADQ